MKNIANLIASGLATGALLIITSLIVATASALILFDYLVTTKVLRLTRFATS